MNYSLLPDGYIIRDARGVVLARAQTERQRDLWVACAAWGVITAEDLDYIRNTI